MTRPLVWQCFFCVWSTGFFGRIVRLWECRIIRSHSVFPVSLLHFSAFSLRVDVSTVGWTPRLNSVLDVSDIVWTLSKGPKESYKYNLANSLVSLIVLSLDHQNHSKWPKWGHVRYTVVDHLISSLRSIDMPKILTKSNEQKAANVHNKKHAAR